MHNGEYVVPSTRPVGENWRFTCKIMKLGPCLTHTYTKVNSKCIKDATVRSATFKLAEEHAGEGLFGARLGNGVSGGRPKPRAAEAKTDQDGGLQGKRCTAKDDHQREGWCRTGGTIWESRC